MRIKQQRPSKYNGQYKKYAPDAVLKACVEAREKKTSLRKVALQFGVPYQTLRDRVSGKVDTDNYGNETVLSREEELTLVEHAENSARLGYGYTNKGLQKTAGEIAYMLGRRSSDKPLSNCWLYGFLHRWEGRISSVKPSALETNRAKCATPEAVSTYFDNLKEVLTRYGLQGKPELIFNVDETGINPEHRPPNVIAPAKEKPQAVTSPRTASTTLIGCANAVGNYLPPYFIFKGKRMNEELMKGTSPGSRGVVSDSGWSTASIFQDYLENHFLRFVQRGPDQHVLLLLDGHSTHTSRQMIDWALARKVVLFVLPAHSSHVLQPLDVAVFGPFKRFYYSECATYMKQNMGKSVTKYEMGTIACRAYLKAMNPVNITAGFRKTGIYPTDQDAVPREKLLPCEAFRDTSPIQKVKAIRAGKDAIEDYLERKKAMTAPRSSSCKCNCQTKRPTPSGKEITSQSFISELENFEANKENRQPAKRAPSTSSPKPSTSGTCQVPKIMNASEYDTEDEETDVCCVCNKFSPPNLNERPHLKIVTWGQYDKCGHWVHLSFCHEKHVIRRGDEFFCKHC